MIDWQPQVDAGVEAEAQALVTFCEAYMLFVQLPPACKVAAIGAFRRDILGRVPKPGTGPLRLPASDSVSLS
jgi:hypothetical protein